MAQPSSDRLSSTDSAEALNFLILDTEEQIINPNILNSQDTFPLGTRRDIVDQSSALGSVGYQKMGYASTASSQPSLLYHGSYDSVAGKQGTYLPYINNEVLENGFHILGIQDKPPSVAYHSYGYSPEMLHKPYVPVTTHLSARNHGHLYNAREISTSNSFSFKQNISPNSFILSPTLVSQAKLSVPNDLQWDSKRSGLRPNYPAPLGSSGRGANFFGKSDGVGLLDQRFEGSEFGGLCSDWLSPSDGKSCMLQLSSPQTSLKPIGSPELSLDEFGLASLQKGSFHGFGSCSGSSYTGYSHRQSDQAFDFGCVSTSRMGLNGQNWPTLTEARQRGRCNDFSCGCSVTLDMLSERNRGPRAFKPKFQTMVNGSAVGNGKNSIIDDLLRNSYNRLDFITSYTDAKFFIIKSYSEDNVYKSIKYGVWASTPNGNKKLDCAYCEAKAKEGMCPVFLLFSVNASAQFCGVAEMVGPVDFDKNVDYWLQDKWTGQFPVKWRSIKDVPNSRFRHILLENNDNKPVTNSRDTQEVEMEQGMEMLNIFKNYESCSSILDDFYFYEKRHKAMQERKAEQQQASLVAPPVAVVSEQQIPVSPSADTVKSMSKSFAEAVSLREHEKEPSAGGNVASSATTSVAHGNQTTQLSSKVIG